MEKTMNKTDALKAIDKAFFEIERACESSSNWQRYLKLHRQEEKGHRRFCPDHVRCGLTLGQSVKLFAVKEIFECITGTQYRPSAEEFFHVRGSIFAVWSIYEDRKEKLNASISADAARLWLASIDYAELNKDPRQLEAA
jgi:hypothetical protein